MRTRLRSIIHGPAFVALVFGILAFGRMAGLILPSEYYFTFQSLFSDRSASLVTLSLLGKMLVPFLAGLACGWFVVRRAKLGAGWLPSFSRRLRCQWSPTLFAAGFFAALLSAWPIIVYWDLLANPAVLHLKAIFLILYFLYMVSFGYMTLLGGLAAVFFEEHLAGRATGTPLVSKLELSRVGLLWLLNSGIASATMEILTK